MYDSWYQHDILEYSDFNFALSHLKKYAMIIKLNLNSRLNPLPSLLLSLDHHVYCWDYKTIILLFENGVMYLIYEWNEYKKGFPFHKFDMIISVS